MWAPIITTFFPNPTFDDEKVPFTSNEISYAKEEKFLEATFSN